MLELILAAGYFSSKGLRGDRLFFRNKPLSSSFPAPFPLGLLSCRPTLGESIWFFIESFREGVLPLLEVEVFWPK